MADRGGGFSISQRLGHIVQAVAAYGVFFFSRLLPFAAASNLGGWLGRAVGPRLSLTERARKNLERAFPEKTAGEIGNIITGMWDNLGRTAFEYPHLDRLKIYGGDIVEVTGAERIDTLKNDGKPGIFFASHMANWEIPPLTVTQRGLPIHMIYRAPNNPLMEGIFRHRRTGDGELIAKGSQGARRSLALLRDGGHLGILVDQKMNDGIAVPFFGRDAMTAPALAHFALKFQCPVVPVQAVRTHGAHFHVIYHQPLEIASTGDVRADAAAIMTKINGVLESWIREHPEQWLWVHNRWPD